jgi:hypothetical protein
MFDQIAAFLLIEAIPPLPLDDDVISGLSGARIRPPSRARQQVSHGDAREGDIGAVGRGSVAEGVARG